VRFPNELARMSGTFIRFITRITNTSLARPPRRFRVRVRDAHPPIGNIVGPYPTARTRNNP